MGTAARALALALSLAVAAGASQTSRASDARGGLARALAEPCAPAELRRRLAALDAAELPQLFCFAALGRLDGVGDEARREAERAAVREALAARPRREVVPFLEDLASRSPEAAERLEAQRLLGAMGSAEHLKLLARLTVLPHERGALAPELRAGFTASLSAILARDAAALASVPALSSESSPGLASSIVEAVAGVPSREATRLLAAMLGRTPGLDPLLLARLAERGPLRSMVDEGVLEAVRRCMRQRDPALVAAAARACGRLGDDDAVEVLIGLMEHGDGRVRASAFDALGRISGLAYGPDSSRWTAWYHAEMRWWDEEAESLLTAIERGRGLEFTRATREALEHRLYRDRIAESLALSLARPSVAEVRIACSALEQLRSARAVEALGDCLEHDDASVRAAALKALGAILGDAPTEERSWSELRE